MKLAAAALFCTAALFCNMVSLGADSNWQKILAERIPSYGHRNWIVIADSAYPAQAKEGIETVVANADQVEVLETVLAALAKSKHVAPIVYIDQELKYLDDAEAPGVEAYRYRLAAIFKDKTVESLPHEKIIEKLDAVSQTFRVLIIKTNMTVPYTSVFLQLDCAYWGPDAERGLRAKMAAAGVR
jgi:L-fucose mutarotase/ribose pyranase (RbsD/FucU family)